MQIDYATQSLVSDPGEYSHLLDNLPRDIPGVARVAQGLVYHYFAGEHIFGHKPDAERIKEIDTRTMPQILARILAMDARPLDLARDYDKRIVGCCRDFSLVACAILRHHGIPARSRYGFASYFEPGYWIDHVIVETWTGTRWQRFDPQMAGVMPTKLDLFDIPPAAFVTGGRAWQMCRQEGADPARFGLGSHVPDVSGWWFVRGRLQLHIAALHKQEMLCWDEWRYALPDYALTAEEEALLDRAAELSGLENSEELTALWREEPRLQVPAAVTCYSPAVGPHPVQLLVGQP